MKNTNNVVASGLVALILTAEAVLPAEPAAPHCPPVAQCTLPELVVALPWSPDDGTEQHNGTNPPVIVNKGNAAGRVLAGAFLGVADAQMVASPVPG